jgi:CrcB protein
VSGLPSTIQILAVALGSGLGALARFMLGQLLLRSDSRQPVLATLAVNLSGCAAAGFLVGALAPHHDHAVSFLLTGFLGSYTTVSSFSLETLGMWQAGRRRLAVSYVITSVAGGLALARAGAVLASGGPW